MKGSKAPLYVPSLRMKKGELLGLRDLATDIADQVLPRLIIPPIGERDDSVQCQLFTEPNRPDIAQSLFAHWGARRALVEATHLFSGSGKSEVGSWLPGMFQRARIAGSEAVPLINLSGLDFDHLKYYNAAIERNYDIELAIAISAENIESDDTPFTFRKILNETRCHPSKCLIIADFHATDLSNISITEPIISGALESLRNIEMWKQIVFQGASYPEFNHAPPSGSLLVPRNEWIAWRRAVKLDRDFMKLMTFGDYAADCSKLKFNAKGGRAIRHYRYTTPEFWLNQRGSDNGSHKIVMREVCKKILDSGHFAGRDFSSADEFIYRTAMDNGAPGGAKEWRAVNTTHHITRVVTDIGTILGMGFKRQSIEHKFEQVSLL